MRFDLVKWVLGGIAIMVMIFLSCAEDITGQRNQNIPPETTVFVQADTLNLTQSVQTIYWDGQDPDGFVVKFLYTWKENPGSADWDTTTNRTETFPLKIAGADTSYRFQVKAVDNDGAEDPTPAVQVFPIKNTPPTIRWTTLSAVPDTTFTVASFVWSASDLDGDSTILEFEYSLDNTQNWKSISGARRQLILNADSGLTAGDHAFYIRAVDVADARSPIIRMPEDTTKFWYVKNPTGRYLLIDDFADESAVSSYPDAFYKGLLDTLLPSLGQDYSYWNIEQQFPTSVVQFTETLKLFDRIIWYTDFIKENDPHFIGAQVAVPQFRNKTPNPGKIIYTVKFNQGFGSQGDPLGFTPVDSIGSRYDLSNNSLYYVDSAYTSHPDYPDPLFPLPELKSSNTSILFGLRALRPKATSVPMYRFDDPNSTNDPLFVMIGKNDNTDEYDFVMAGTPLNQLNGNKNIGEFFKIVFRDIFTLD